MKKINNNFNQEKQIIKTIPSSIRNAIHSVVVGKSSNTKKKKGYKNNSPFSTLTDFKETIENHYIQQSSTKLKYKVFNLMNMTDNNGKLVYNFNNFKKYISYIDEENGLTKDNTVIQDLTGEYLFNIDKSESAKNFAKVKYIEHYNQNKLKVFITFTNPSEYHFLKNSGTKINHKCKFDTFEETIEESIKLQVKINRYFYNQLKKYLKRACIDNEVDFVRQLEAHENMCAHSHSLYFIEEYGYEVLVHVYNQVIKKFKLNKKDGCKIEIVDSAKASTYVAKYIIKTLHNEDIKDNFHNHYKRYYSKYRFFTSSNYKHTNQKELNKTYSYLKKTNPKLIDRFKKSSFPLYVLLEKYINRSLIFEYEEQECKTTDYKKVKEFIKDYRYVSEKLGDNSSEEKSNNDLYLHLLKNIHQFQTKTKKSKKIRFLKCKHTNKILKDYSVKIPKKSSIKEIILKFKETL